MTCAETVAAFLAEREITEAFGIIGAGNVKLYDAIARLGKTELVCVHHEQAAVMAANAWSRMTGKPGVAIVTTGAGSSNALTGVLSAFMDSIPVVVIAGNEASTRKKIGRSIGVQGYDSVAVAKPMTAWRARMRRSEDAYTDLMSAFSTAANGRPGPAWLEIPMDLQ